MESVEKIRHYLGGDGSLRERPCRILGIILRFKTTQ